MFYFPSFISENFRNENDLEVMFCAGTLGILYNKTSTLVSDASKYDSGGGLVFRSCESEYFPFVRRYLQTSPFLTSCVRYMVGLGSDCVLGGLGRDCLTQLARSPASPSYGLKLTHSSNPRRPFSEALILSRWARFIAWRLRRPFFGKCRLGPRHFCVRQACLGYGPEHRTP